METEMEKVDISDLEKEERLKKLDELTDEELMEATKNDRCPHCGSNPHDYPYISYFPQFAWLECCICGTVFCPLSRRLRKKQYVRDKKLKGEDGSLIEPVESKIVTPKLILK